MIETGRLVRSRMTGRIGVFYEHVETPGWNFCRVHFQNDRAMTAVVMKRDEHPLAYLSTAVDRPAGLS